MKLIALTLLAAAPLAAQTNDLPLHNGGDYTYFASTPPGPASGTVPPSLNGVIEWRVYPGDRVLLHQGAAGATMEISGYSEVLFDTDWATPPEFFDRSHGAALPTAAGELQPAFFQSGWTSEVLVSLGPSGFANPCTIVPSLCSPSGGSCPPPGFINGYTIDLAFGGSPGTGIVIPADGTAASDHAVAWFYPPNMSAIGGTCGAGDLTQQLTASSDETQIGVPGGPYGINPYAGSSIAAVPANFDAFETLSVGPQFRDRVLNARADSGVGLGVEAPTTGGGATNGLRLWLGSGASTLGWEIASEGDIGVPSIAAVGVSTFALAPPGITVMGANVLVAPSSLFQQTLGTMVAPAFGGVYATPQIPVPAPLVGTDVFAQGFVLHTATGLAWNTNVVRTSFFP